MVDFNRALRNDEFPEGCSPELPPIPALDYVPTVDAFCEKYDVELTGIEISAEEGFREPIFSFTDYLGYYNLDAMRDSLQD